MNLVTPKAEAKHELLFNKPASGSHLVALLKSILDGQQTHIKLIEVGLLNKRSYLAAALGVTKFITTTAMIILCYAS
jgi:hypothetical protein